MRLSTAIKRIQENYERAKSNKSIRKPVAWSLYKAWQWAETYEKVRNK